MTIIKKETETVTEYGLLLLHQLKSLSNFLKTSVIIKLANVNTKEIDSEKVET